MAIKIGDLAKAVMKELDDYGVAVGLEVEKVSKEVAEDTAKILNKTSPKADRRLCSIMDLWDGRDQKDKAYNGCLRG